MPDPNPVQLTGRPTRGLKLMPDSPCRRLTDPGIGGDRTIGHVACRSCRMRPGRRHPHGRELVATAAASATCHPSTVSPSPTDATHLMSPPRSGQLSCRTGA